VAVRERVIVAKPSPEGEASDVHALRAFWWGGQRPGVGIRPVVSNSPWSLLIRRLCSLAAIARSRVAVTYW
jgi:hypothetical protein